MNKENIQQTQTSEINKNLSLLVRRMARALKRHGVEPKLADTGMQYLRDNQLMNPLRDAVN